MSLRARFARAFDFFGDNLMTEDVYQQRFLELDELLASHSQWWQIGSFQSRDFPWQPLYPDLIDQLLSLNDAELQLLETQPQQLSQWLSSWVKGAKRLLQLSQLSSLPLRQLTLPNRLEVGIKGRKWGQIQQFAAAIPEMCEPTLEWCSGKGHLGRLIASIDGAPVTSLEWQQTLCEAGQVQAQRADVPQSFLQMDAESKAAAEQVGKHKRVLALHVCGSLHTELIKLWASSASKYLALAPCCYHLINGDEYMPLSVLAKQGRVRLSKQCLSLPLQEEVTGGATVRRRRQKELLWRLAFDEWQRETRGRDEYLPLPGFPKSLLATSFTEFISWAATRKGLEVPRYLDESLWLQRAALRARKVRLIELVMHLFRRPLEMWLILDRVIYLQQYGAEVSIGAFCDRALTPRNILIYAQR